MKKKFNSSESNSSLSAIETTAKTSIRAAVLFKFLRFFFYGAAEIE